MLNTKQQEFVDYAVKKFGTNELSVAELKEANKHFGNKYAPHWLIRMLTIKLVSLYLSYPPSLVRYLLQNLQANLKKF